MDIKVGDDAQLWSFDGDTDEPLPALRAALTKSGLMLESDLFLRAGSTVPKKSEGQFTIKDIATHESNFTVVLLKRAVAPEPKPPEEKKPIQPAPPLPNSTEPTKGPPVVPTNGIDGKLDAPRPTETASTEAFQHYINLTPEERNQVFAACNLFRGVCVSSEDLRWSYSQCVTLKESREPQFVTPQSVWTMHEFSTYTKSASEAGKFVGTDVSASAAGTVFGLSVGYKKERGTTNRSESEKLYLYSECVAAKVKLKLKPDDLEGTPEFLKAIEEFAHCSQRPKLRDWDALKEFLNDWGAHLPTEVVLGGKLYYQEDSTIDAKSTAEMVESSFKAAASAAFSAASISAGVQIDNKDSQQTNTASKQRQINLEAFGGDPARANSPSEWAASLGEAQKWRLCTVLATKPIYSFGSSAARMGIRNILGAFAQEWRTAFPLIDYNQYFGPLDQEVQRRFED